MNIESFMLATTLRLLAAMLVLMTLTVAATRAETAVGADERSPVAGTAL